MRRVGELSAFQVKEIRIIKAVPGTSWQSILLIVEEGFIEITAFHNEDRVVPPVHTGEHP